MAANLQPVSLLLRAACCVLPQRRPRCRGGLRVQRHDMRARTRGAQEPTRWARGLDKQAAGRTPQALQCVLWSPACVGGEPCLVRSGLCTHTLSTLLPHRLLQHVG